MNHNSLAFRFYSQIAVGIVGLAAIIALCFAAHIVGDRRRVFEDPIKPSILTDGSGDSLHISSGVRFYPTRKYFIWEISGARLAFMGRDLGSKYESGGSTRPIWQITSDPGKRGAKSGNFREEFWSEGRTLHQRLWEDIEFTITDGVLTLDGREFNLLERPRLIILDAQGRFVSEQALPLGKFLKQRREIDPVVRELRGRGR